MDEVSSHLENPLESILQASYHDSDMEHYILQPIQYENVNAESSLQDTLFPNIPEHLNTESTTASSVHPSSSNQENVIGLMAEKPNEISPPESTSYEPTEQVLPSATQQHESFNLPSSYVNTTTPDRENMTNLSTEPPKGIISPENTPHELAEQVLQGSTQQVVSISLPRTSSDQKRAAEKHSISRTKSKKSKVLTEPAQSSEALTSSTNKSETAGDEEKLSEANRTFRIHICFTNE